MMNNSNRKTPNGVNGNYSAPAVMPSPGRSEMVNQVSCDRQPVTGRARWSTEANRKLMELYYRSRIPKVYGFRKRLHQLWNESNEEQMTEQKICGQARSVQVNKLLSQLELDEIEKSVKTSMSGEIDNLSTSVEEVPSISVEISDSLQQESNERVIPQASDSIKVREPADLDEKTLVDAILEQRERLTTCRTRLKSLRNVENGKIMKEVRKVNKALECVEVKDITEVNNTIWACANLITEKVSPAQEKNRTPWWKRRLERKVKEIRKDLSRVNECQTREWNDPLRKQLEYKYRIKSKGYKVAIEELKQRLKATAAKLKGYNERERQFRENRMFTNNQGRFFQMLNKGECTVTKPDSEQSKRFWEGIWSKNEMHNHEANWLEHVKSRFRGIEKQQDVVLSLEDIENVIKKMPNWKAPGPDGVQGFWIKRLTTMHSHIATFLQQCLKDASVPEWMTSGRTVLVLKDPAKGNDAGNYRPITCLPLMWKALTGAVANILYEHLESNNIIGDEQKGCRRAMRGTKDHLMLDKVILKDCKGRHTNMAIAWIDYKKAYDMVPHSWILESMRVTGMAANVVCLIENSMRSWNTQLEYMNERLAQIDIKRGIFQGDSLSPLLFITALIPLSVILRDVDAGYQLRNRTKVNHLLFMDDLKLYGKNKQQIERLIQTTRIFSDDIKMSFGLGKCATLVMKRGKRISDTGIEVGKEVMKDLGECDYKYLGILESDAIKSETMKQNIKTMYLKRVEKILKTKLNGGNTVRAINVWAISMVRYSAGIIEWTQEELRVMDRETRKRMRWNRALHPRADVHRLYLPRDKGGRGLMSVEDCVRLEEVSLSDYVKRMEKASAETYNIFKRSKSRAEERKKRNEDKMEAWKSKALHGQYVGHVEDLGIADWGWLIEGRLKKETEGMMMAAQDQALPQDTRNMRVNVYGETGSAKCRMCDKVDETIMHIVSECEVLAQGEYKRRHDKVATRIHCELCKTYNFPYKKWYQHRAEGVLENEKAKILWDINIQTRYVIEHRRPDIILIDKESNNTLLIDIAVPGDLRVKKSECEKREKYEELRIEIEKVWKTKARVVPIVVGAMGAQNDLKKYVTGVLEFKDNIVNELQSIAVLGTSHILRKVLTISV